MRNLAYERVIDFLEDEVPEVRAAAVFALGCFVRNRSVNNEHATAVCFWILHILVTIVFIRLTMKSVTKFVNFARMTDLSLFEPSWP